MWKSVQNYVFNVFEISGFLFSFSALQRYHLSLNDTVCVSQFWNLYLGVEGVGFLSRSYIFCKWSNRVYLMLFASKVGSKLIPKYLVTFSIFTTNIWYTLLHSGSQPGCRRTLEKALGVTPVSELDVYFLINCS